MAGVVRISIVGRATDAIRALRQTERQAKRTERGVQGLRREMNRLGGTGSTFGAVATVMASRIGLIALAVVSVIQPAVALGAALAPLAGLVIAIPALALAAGGAMGAFKLAVLGVSDAVKAGMAVNDPQSLEAYRKTLAGLSGPTRQFVAATVGLKPALGLLRDSVSANFFAGFSRDVKPLAAIYLPLLKVGLSGIAKSLGGLVSGVGKALASPVFTKGVGDVLRDTAEAIKLATPGVSRLTKSFGRLFSVGSPLLLKLGKAIGDLADKFAKFIDKSAGNGALTRWLDKATKAFGELWDITGNLLSIIGSIFSVGGEGSGGLLANIRELTGRFSAFLKTGEGRAQLREFFANLSQLSKTIWSLLTAIAPIALTVAGFFSREILPAVRSIADHFRNHQGQLQAILITALALKLAWGGINAAILIASVSQRAFAAINVLSGAGAGAGSAAGAATAGKFVGAFTAVAAAGFAAYFGTTWLLKATGWDQALARFGQRLGEADSPWAFIGRQFTNGLSAVFTWLGSLPGRVFNIGFQIVEGLKRGIAAAVAQALGFFASIGTSILNSIKSKLGIHSPSRAAALIGQQFMAGLIGGLKTGLPQLSTTIGGVSSALTGGFSTAALSGTTASVAPGAGANGGTVINVNVPPTADMASVGRTLIDAVKAYEKSSGRVVLVPGF